MVSNPLDSSGALMFSFKNSPKIENIDIQTLLEGISYMQFKMLEKQNQLLPNKRI